MATIYKIETTFKLPTLKDAKIGDYIRHKGDIYLVINTENNTYSTNVINTSDLVRKWINPLEEVEIAHDVKINISF